MVNELDLTELRQTAERLSHHWHEARRTGKTARTQAVHTERAIAGDHFRPELILALLDRLEAAEAEVVRVEALATTLGHFAETSISVTDREVYAIARDGIREALAGEPS